MVVIDTCFRPRWCCDLILLHLRALLRVAEMQITFGLCSACSCRPAVPPQPTSLAHGGSRALPATDQVALEAGGTGIALTSRSHPRPQSAARRARTFQRPARASRRPPQPGSYDRALGPCLSDPFRHYSVQSGPQRLIPLIGATAVSRVPAFSSGRSPERLLALVRVTL